MLVTRARTERPHGALLQPDTGIRYCMYRIGGRRRREDASLPGADVGIPPLQYWVSNLPPLPGGGTMSGGEFDWGGRLRKGIGGARRSPQDGWKPSIECKGRRRLDCDTDGWSIKATLGITGLSLPRVHIDGVVWHLDVGSSHPGAGAGSKGWAVRPLKRYASWVQNVVRQFGPYPARAWEI